VRYSFKKLLIFLSQRELNIRLQERGSSLPLSSQIRLTIHVLHFVLIPADTYVKTYLRERDGEKWLQKRKTRVVRHSKSPQYRQTLKYGRCDVLQGRHLLVMLWEKKQGFESNQGLGGAEVDLDSLPPKEFIFDWYPLFPIHTLGTHNADSPWWLREKWALEAGELDLRLSLLLKDEGEPVVKIISWWKPWLIIRQCGLAWILLLEATAFLIITSSA